MNTVTYKGKALSQLTDILTDMVSKNHTTSIADMIKAIEGYDLLRKVVDVPIYFVTSRAQPSPDPRINVVSVQSVIYDHAKGPTGSQGLYICSPTLFNRDRALARFMYSVFENVVIPRCISKGWRKAQDIMTEDTGKPKGSWRYALVSDEELEATAESKQNIISPDIISLLGPRTNLFKRMELVPYVKDSKDEAVLVVENKYLSITLHPGNRVKLVDAMVPTDALRDTRRWSPKAESIVSGTRHLRVTIGDVLANWHREDSVPASPHTVQSERVGANTAFASAFDLDPLIEGKGDANIPEPNDHQTKEGDMHLHHREYIRELKGSLVNITSESVLRTCENANATLYGPVLKWEWLNPNDPELTVTHHGEYSYVHKRGQVADTIYMVARGGGEYNALGGEDLKGLFNVAVIASTTSVSDNLMSRTLETMCTRNNRYGTDPFDILGSSAQNRNHHGSVPLTGTEYPGMAYRRVTEAARAGGMARQSQSTRPHSNAPAAEWHFEDETLNAFIGCLKVAAINELPISRESALLEIWKIRDHGEYHTPVIANRCGTLTEQRPAPMQCSSNIIVCDDRKVANRAIELHGTAAVVILINK